jgi:predicted transposase YdaD
VLPRCHSDISVFVKMTFSTLKILRIVNVIFYMFISVIKVKPNLLMIGMKDFDLEINIKLVRVNYLWYGNNAFHGNNNAGMALYQVTVFVFV